MLNKAFSTSSWHVSWKGLLMDNFRPSTSYQNYGSDSVFKQFDDVSRIWEKKYNFADLFQSIICRFLVHPKLETVQYIRQKRKKKLMSSFLHQKHSTDALVINLFSDEEGYLHKDWFDVQKEEYRKQYTDYNISSTGLTFSVATLRRSARHAWHTRKIHPENDKRYNKRRKCDIKVGKSTWWQSKSYLNG